MKRSMISQEIQWLLEEKYKGREGESFAKDIQRLQKGEHIDYVIGFVDFLGCKIDLSKKPLIPRPETEYWVEKAIGDIRKDMKRNLQCLDLFAGSGCIGVAVLKHVSQAHVDFAEKGKKFCDQIRINAKLNDIEKKRYRVVQSDLFSSLKGRKYDFVFANPPYLAELKKNKVQASVLRHEPKEALFAGKDGLDVIRLFLNQVKDFLAPGGKIYLEFDSFQKPLIAKILRARGFRHFEFHKDQYSNWRFAVIKN